METEEQLEYASLVVRAREKYGRKSVFVTPSGTGGFSINTVVDKKSLEFVVEPRRRYVHVYHPEQESEAKSLIDLCQKETETTWEIKRHYEHL